MRIILLAGLLTILWSCSLTGGKKIRGNGKISSQALSLTGFTNLEAGGAVSVHLKQEPAAAVRIETDENLMEFLDIKVDGNTLVIQPKEGYNLDPSKEVNVYVSAASFKNIEVTGASSLSTDGTINGDEMRLHASGASNIDMDVKLSKLNADLSGASSLRLKGEAEKFSVGASGASNIRCLDLTTNETKVDVSGASKASVSAEKELEIDASGASEVEYRGAADIKQKSSGASNVKKI